MTHHLLYASTRGLPALLPWQMNLSSRGIVVLRAGRIEEALPYCATYAMMMILLDIKHPDEEILEAVARLKNAIDAGYHAPLIGLCHVAPSDAERAALAAAGLDDVIVKNDPPRFIMWRLEMLAALGELRHFEQSRMDVANLALKTREHLHDLSQPLSAVQGRLQLMAARLPEGDPSAQQFNELVKLIFEVSQHVVEIHQIHRQYS